MRRLLPVTILVLLVSCRAQPRQTPPPTAASAPAPTTRTVTTRAATTNPFARWEKDVAAFEAKDRESMPAKGSVLFVGSSTIVRWKTMASDFPNVTTLNRGFGGNQIADCTHFAERIIFPY